MYRRPRAIPVIGVAQLIDVGELTQKAFGPRLVALLHGAAGEPEVGGRSHVEIALERRFEHPRRRVHASDPIETESCAKRGTLRFRVARQEPLIDRFGACELALGFELASPLEEGALRDLVVPLPFRDREPLFHGGDPAGVAVSPSDRARPVRALRGTGDPAPALHQGEEVAISA